MVTVYRKLGKAEDFEDLEDLLAGGEGGEYRGSDKRRGGDAKDGGKKKKKGMRTCVLAFINM